MATQKISLTTQQIEDMIEAAAARAASKALQDVGLGPQNADDVKEITKLLSSYKDFKKTVLQTFAKWLTITVLGFLTLGLAMSQWPEAVKKISS